MTPSDCSPCASTVETSEWFILHIFPLLVFKKGYVFFDQTWCLQAVFNMFCFTRFPNPLTNITEEFSIVSLQWKMKQGSVYEGPSAFLWYMSQRFLTCRARPSIGSHRKPWNPDINSVERVNDVSSTEGVVYFKFTEIPLRLIEQNSPWINTQIRTPLISNCAFFLSH